MIKIFLLFTLIISQTEVSGSKFNQGGEALRQKGISEKNRGNYQTALNYYYKSRIVFQGASDSIGLASVYNNIGIVKFYLAEFDSCIFYYNESLKLFEQLNDQNGIGKVRIGLGNYYSYEDKDLNEALRQYSICRDIFTKLNNQFRLLTINNNIGNVFRSKSLLQKDHALDSAKKHYRHAIKIGRDLLARSNLSTNQSNSVKIQIAGSLMNLGVSENEAEKDDALQYLTESLKIFEELRSKFKVASVYINLSNYYKNRIKSKALKYNKLAYNIALDNNYWDIAHSSSKNLSNLYNEVNRFDSASKYFKIYIAYNDSVYNENKTKEIENLKTKYETEKKEQEIKTQKQEIQLKTSQRDTYLITLVIALSLTIGLVFIYQQRQRAIAQLRKKEKNLYDQKVDDLLKDEEIKSLNAMMSGQENERKRIAEDLHDRLGSKLAAVKLHYDASAEKVGSDTSFKKAAKILDETIEETRKIAHNLLSGVLTKFGLIAALEDLKNTIEGTKEITFELNTSNIDDRLPNDLEINIYRIVQELISNMLKHARAKNISVQLTKHDDNSLTLMVEDDGVGFNTLEKKDGIGLQNMQARAEKFDGEIMIDSTIGRGTTTTINLQIPQS